MKEIRRNGGRLPIALGARVHRWGGLFALGVGIGLSAMARADLAPTPEATPSTTNAVPTVSASTSPTAAVPDAASTTNANSGATAPSQISAPEPSASTRAAASVPPPGNAPASSPSPAANAAPAANHEQPSSPSSFSLHPGAASSPPEVSPSGNEIFPDAFHENNPSEVGEDLAAHLLVVYNSKDPDSKGLAEYYAARRNIPAERVLGISAPVTEEITREQYDNTIRSPIVSYLSDKNWMVRQMRQVRVGDRFLNLFVATRNDIWAIVLMRGVPLKIAPDTSNPDAMEPEPILQTNAAAVDNELALLPVYGLPEGGYVPNIFFGGLVTGIHRIGPELARNMVLVTRLDGPKVSDVRRMIDDSVSVEKTRLAGLAVVDTRGLTDLNNGYTAGDVWLRSSRDALVADGWPVAFDDRPDVIPPTDPVTGVAVYLGWYHDGAYGPWVTLPNRFVPGAVAYHLHSYSAYTVRSETERWVGPLIAHGADATMGMVYEPYLALTPHEDIFIRRLLEGGYFAEAAYASEGALSWMLTVVGDPLYRPFRRSLESALADATVPHTAHDDWLNILNVRRQLMKGTLPADPASLKRALEVPGAGAVAEEGLGDLLSEIKQDASSYYIRDAYRRALASSSAPIDKVRIGLKLAKFFSAHGNEDMAQRELESLRLRYPVDAGRFGVASTLVPTSIAPSPPRPPPDEDQGLRVLRNR